MRGLFLMVCLAMASTAYASPGKAKKAEKLYAAFEAGDREALEEARQTLEGAIGHAKVEGDAHYWILLGRMRHAEGASTRDLATLAAAVEATEKGLDLGPTADDEAAATDVLKSTYGLLVTALAEASTAKRYDDGYTILDAVEKALARLTERGIRLDGLRERMLIAAIVVSAESGHLDDALRHHEAFFAEGWFDAGLASMIARAYGDDGTEAAIAFLAPLREEYPSDERLLRAHVDLLHADADAARAVVDAARERLWSSLSGAMLVADLYDEMGADEAALDAYAHLLTMDATHRDALLRTAAATRAEADALAATLEEPGLKRKEEQAKEEALAALRAEVVAKLERAREAHGRDREVLEALKAAYEANRDDDAAIEVQAALDALEGQ